MSLENQTNDREINFSDISKKLKSSADSLNATLFSMLQFFVRNAVVFGICVVVGVALGFYLDRTKKTYDSEIVVLPNFGSVDYLYDKVGLLKSKIREGDTLFLSKLGIKNADKLLDINIEPVVDVYPFVNRSEANFEMVKLMAEDADMKQIVEDPVTSKNFSEHLITFTTLHKTVASQTVVPILNYLNNSAFYSKIQKEYQSNQDQKVVANLQTIEQINSILNHLGNQGAPSSNVYINQNTQLNDVIHTKDELIKENAGIRIDKVKNDRIVKDNSIITNIKATKSVSGKYKLVLPLLFLFLAVITILFTRFYKAQKARRTQNNL